MAIDLAIIKEEPARITAILNCYAPDGANRGQVILRADGEVKIMGDRSLAIAAINALRKRSGKAPSWQLRPNYRPRTRAANSAE